MNIFYKYKQFFKTYGLIETLIKIISKPLRLINKKTCKDFNSNYNNNHSHLQLDLNCNFYLR